MIVVLTSDIHLGSGHPKHVKRMLSAVASWRPDLYINAGDDNGSYWGARGSIAVTTMEREALPNTKIAKVPGNHDFWLLPTKPGSGARDRARAGVPGADEWLLERERLFAFQKSLDVHVFNVDGVLPFGGWNFIGHTMWYEEARPNTNDAYYLPVGLSGDTNRHLFHEGYKGLGEQMDLVMGSGRPLAVVTHFPLTGPRFTADGGFTLGDDPNATNLGCVLIEDYGAKAFLNDHMHEQHLGPLRFEAGSNMNVGGPMTPRYDHPRFLVLDFKGDGTVEVLKSCARFKGGRPDY